MFVNPNEPQTFTGAGPAARHRLGRLQRAYAAAGLDYSTAVPLEPVRAIEARRAALRDAAAEGERALAAAHAWTPGDARALKALAERHRIGTYACDALTLVERTADDDVLALTAEAMPAMLAELRPAFETAAAKLADAASRLPGGLAALDLPAVVEAHASSEFEAARDALAVLATVAAVLPPLHGEASKVDGYALARLATMPDPGAIPRIGDGAAQTPERLAIREAAKAFHAVPELTVLRVARGDWAGISLALPADADDLCAREAQLGDAHRWHNRRAAL